MRKRKERRSQYDITTTTLVLGISGDAEPVDPPKRGQRKAIGSREPMVFWFRAVRVRNCNHNFSEVFMSEWFSLAKNVLGREGIGEFDDEFLRGFIAGSEAAEERAHKERKRMLKELIEAATKILKE